MTSTSGRRAFPRLAIGVGLIVPATLYAATAAAAPRGDYDLDDNGLIEINDLQDLDEIRNEPFGTHLYGSDAGCPMPVGCRGFELTADLDFDTNGDGSVDDLDDFYIPGFGWEPIATLAAPFQGHGHRIANLTIVQASGDFDAIPTGLFSTLAGAVVNDLHLENVYIVNTDRGTGALAGHAYLGSEVTKVSVVGGSIDTANMTAFGGVIGSCEFSSVSESYTSLEVIASESVGGLIGHADQCTVARSFVLGRTVNGRYHRAIGGLVGTMWWGSIDDSFVSGTTGLGVNFGGLIGETDSFPPTVTNSYVSGAVVGRGSKGGALLGIGEATFVGSYYATNTTGFQRAKTGGDPAALGVSLADLQCPQFASDPACLVELFAGWDASTNSDAEPAWDFGDQRQVPALRIDGVVYRDSDGDGVLDGDDEFPYNWEASLDSDDDGSIDFWREGCDEQCRAGSSLVLDQFPNNAAATLDLDLDGQPDAWNPGCGTACQTASNLTLDSSPFDMDNDGLSDLDDPDDGNNGFPDADSDSDNLIDINNLLQLAQVTLDPTGASRRVSTAIQVPGDVEDTSGCLPRVVRGTLRRECDGYELLTDLDFDLDSNGIIDENDAFSFGFDYNGDGMLEDSWADGNGWLPLGRLGDLPLQAFQTNFEGNGHSIANLYVNRGDAGLFGGVSGANIRNLGLVGSAMSVVGESRVGPLAAHLLTSTVSNCYSTGPVVSTTSATGVGGLIGDTEDSFITGSFATGDVETIDGFTCGTGGLVGHMAHDAQLTTSFATGSVMADCAIRPNTEIGTAGGLVGTANAGTWIDNSFSTGPVLAESDAEAGGLVGRSQESVLASYWATDSSGQTQSSGNPQPALLAELECPEQADNFDDCLAGATLYDGWGSLRSTTHPYWDFGSSAELPGLCLDGSLYRADGAGTLQAAVDCPCSLDDVQLVSNQGFESGAAGWNGFGTATVAASSSQAQSGSSSLRVANRTAAWNGADYNLLNLAAPGETLDVSLWARLENDSNEPVFFTLRSTCQGATTSYTTIAQATVTDTGWSLLSGTVTVPDCNLTGLAAYAEGPSAGVNFYVDNVSITNTTLDCDSGDSGDLTGITDITNDWGSGFCAEVVVTNGGDVATSDWSAEFNLNGAVIYDIWNLDTTGSSGTVSVSPLHSWGRIIQPGASTYSLGFCANRPGGGSALPDEILDVYGEF